MQFIASEAVSKCNKLVQLVEQIQYHVNGIYSLGGGHTYAHTQTYRLCGQKQFQETRRMPGLKSAINRISQSQAITIT